MSTPLCDDKNKRFTKAHIETLGFVQDMIRENAELIQRIEQMEADAERLRCSSRQSAKAETLAQTLQEEMQRRAAVCEPLHARAQEAVQMERSFEKTRVALNKEIESLKSMLASNENQHEMKTKKLQLELGALRETVRQLNAELAENSKCHNDISAQQPTDEQTLQELDSLRKQVLQLTKELEEQQMYFDSENSSLSQQFKVLNKKCKVAEEELQASQQARQELRLELEKLQRACRDDSFAERALHDVISNQKVRIEQLKLDGAQLSNLHQENAKLSKESLIWQQRHQTKSQEFDAVCQELQRVRQAMMQLEQQKDTKAPSPPPTKNHLCEICSTGANFRDFVELRRELIQVREQNDLLVEKIASSISRWC